MVLPAREIARRMGRTLRWDGEGIAMERCGTVEWHAEWSQIERFVGKRSGPMHMHYDTVVVTREGAVGLIPMRWGSPWHRAEPLWQAIDSHVPEEVLRPDSREYEVPPSIVEVRTLFAAGIALMLFAALSFKEILLGGALAWASVLAFFIGPSLTAVAALGAWRRYRQR